MSIRNGTIALALAFSCLLGVPRSAKADAALDYTNFDTYPMPGGFLYSSTHEYGPSWVKNLNGKLPVRAQPSFRRAVL
jgi:hypothetical protein